MSKFNDDELHAPNWMDKEFFEDVLKNIEKCDKVTVSEFKFSPASSQGDHYASIMFRAAVIYDTNLSKDNKRSLIIKTMPVEDGYKKEILQETFIFETEIAMYKEALPKLHAELRKIGDDTVLGLQPLYATLKPRKVIIFDDLCPKGYQTLRNRKITEEQTKAAFTKLAKWHAVSYKLAAEGDTSLTTFQDSLINMKEFETMPFIKSGMENFIDKVQQIDDLKQYVPNLLEAQKDVVKRTINSAQLSRQKDAKGIFVLLHGDFHVTNMMFKNDSCGKFEDVMLIDFQISFFGPAVMDVIYGMYLLADREMRLNQYDELVYFYCSTFIDTLKKTKFEGEIPKISDFYIELLRHRHWELLLLTTFLPIFYAKDDMNPDEMMESNEMRRKAYDCEEYIEEVKVLLPKMFHRGYLE